jgi:cobalt-zinc-cadmium resistance protein CzcA
MSENVVRMLAQRQREHGRRLTPGERRQTVLAACKQVGRPTVFGVAIITIVYLPIFSLTGIEGKMFAPMAFTVVFALTGALVLAFTLTPVLCSLLMSGKIREGDNPLMRLAKRAYRPALELGLRLRWLVVTAALAVFALSVWTFQKLGAEFIPRLDEGSLIAQMARTTSIGLDASLEMQTAAEKLLLEKFPEITRTFAVIGTSEVANHPADVNIAETYIMLKPRAQWRRAPAGNRPVTKDELAALISRELALHFPAQATLFSQPVELRLNEMISGSRADIAIKIFGGNHETIEKIAGQIFEIVEKIPGAADVGFEAAGVAPELQITMNRAAMTRYNIHAAEVNKVIEAAFAGVETGVIVEGNRRHPIVTRLREEERRDFASIASLPVKTADGNLITLGQVAGVTMTEGIKTISREAFQRRMAVQVNLRGRDVQSFIDEARAKIAAQVKLPEGYFIEYGGAFKNLQEARARLALVVPAALALIFLLIFLAFGSARQALMVYTGIPLAVSGGIFSLALRDMPFSISAAVGFIALSGVAVLNGVVMVSFINQLREAGKPVREAVIEGALTRLRPVLMTALVAAIGFVPMALATGPGAEVQRPIATVVIGGIITATFLTLILLPVLYNWLERADTRTKSGKTL